MGTFVQLNVAGPPCSDAVVLRLCNFYDVMGATSIQHSPKSPTHPNHLSYPQHVLTYSPRSSYVARMQIRDLCIAPSPCERRIIILCECITKSKAIQGAGRNIQAQDGIETENVRKQICGVAILVQRLFAAHHSTLDLCLVS